MTDNRPAPLWQIQLFKKSSTNFHVELWLHPALMLGFEVDEYARNGSFWLGPFQLAWFLVTTGGTK